MLIFIRFYGKNLTFMALQIHLLFTHSEEVFHFFRKLIIEKRIDNWIGDVVYDVHSVHKKHTSAGKI